jgi:transposase
LVPKRPADRVKTDRRDAVGLARLLAVGELSFARVPTLAAERFRDLVRTREGLRREVV